MLAGSMPQAASATWALQEVALRLLNEPADPRADLDDNAFAGNAFSSAAAMSQPDDLADGRGYLAKPRVLADARVAGS